MIKEFDTMFPRCLWVAKDTNYKELSDRFVFYSPSSEELITYDENEFNENTFDESIYATVYLVVDKIIKKTGYLVILNGVPSINDCAHEASHIVTHLEKYFGIESDANEYRAYMTGWFAEKINEACDGNENQSQPIAK